MAVLRCSTALSIVIFFCIVLITSQVLQVHGQSQIGFISIDCGIPDGPGYEDPSTKIHFSSDAPYIDAGESKNVSAAGQIPQFQTLRSFPNGTRNCYRLRPVRTGGKYLVRAGFWFRGYDGRFPAFDLHIGPNFWDTVSFASADAAVYKDVITVAPAESIWVCLVNTGKGTPFISTLELRPLLVSMYAPANPSQSLVLIQDRTNYGSNTSRVRYPDDPYDRIWFGYVEGVATMISARQGLMPKTKPDDGFQVPSTVLRTAFTGGGITQGPVSGRPGEGVYVAMHFSEIQELLPNETRRMNIYEGAPGDNVNGPLLYGDYSPPFLVAETRDDEGNIGGQGTYSLPNLSPSAASTRNPIINALEVFAVRPMENLTTDNRDVDAMEDIKRAYKIVKRNWMGDPCAPQEFVWDGLNCSYEALIKHQRIVYLNLASSGLSGGIPASIANLTALTTLDLSRNNLTGPIPDFLAKLSSLKSLNLTGNILTGTIPRDLCEKVQNGALLLSTEGNIEPCSLVAKKKKKTSTLVMVVAASLAILTLLVVSILVWRLKRQKTSEAPRDLPKTRQGNDIGSNREGHRFTFSEITSITKNFGTKIGRGGFGTVYLGYLEDGTQVAVKVLSQSSSQGAKEFQTEAVLLTRVHHKNLVFLLGYCDEEQNMALVYEYMDQGTLHDHLSGKTETIHVLSWEQRVNIALQAAQGLDYLHNGCRPPIIHRDVKSANILLNHNFVAKLADFGLSRAFDDENLTHLSTAVVGTLGYVDPEYYETYRLNEKSDVYSFGIVLLEIITGRPAFSNLPEKIHILKWVQSRVKCGDIESIVDSRLQSGGHDSNSIWKVLEIAMACTSSAPAQRTTMGNVVTQLKACLVREVSYDSDKNFGMPSWNSVETLPLNVIINSDVLLPTAR